MNTYRYPNKIWLWKMNSNSYFLKNVTLRFDLDLDRWPWYQRQSLAQRNMQLKYESSFTNHSKVMANVKVFLKKFDLDIWPWQKTLTDDLDLGTKERVLPQEIHMWNMKALSLTTQKLRPMLNFSSHDCILYFFYYY